MRVLWLTCLLFTVMLLVISHNYFYINSVSEQIIYLVGDERFAVSPRESIRELEEYWNENLLFVGFSVAYRELDNLTELIVALKSYYDSVYDAEVARVRARICDAAQDMARLESFSLENLI